MKNESEHSIVITPSKWEGIPVTRVALPPRYGMEDYKPGVLFGSATIINPVNRAKWHQDEETVAKFLIKAGTPIKKELPWMQIAIGVILLALLLVLAAR